MARALLLLAAAGLVPAPAVHADEARAEAAAKEAEEAIRSRDFAKAAAKFDEALADVPDGKWRRSLAGRREDADLAGRGIDALARAVGEHPNHFARIEIAKGIVADVTAADRARLTGAVQGGTSQFPWGAVDRKALASMVERARLPAADLLGAAALLQLAGEEDAAEQAVLRHLKGGADAAAAARALARWRNEDPPAGGYVEVAGHLLTPADRDRLLLEEKKAAAYENLLSEDAAKRATGYRDLRALGDAGKITLARGLRARRAAVARQMGEMKVFSSAATKARIKAEVEKRRADALALIEDEARYPYPSEDHRGQTEVDRLVDLVRQAWERPFDVVASWDPAVAEKVRLVAEVDARLAESEEGYEPDMAAAQAPADAALDVPGMFRDDYSEKVLEYDAKVRTSADIEERDCVLAVNEYRILMGRVAVKIDERLVRSARGHSKHMRLNGYFSHNNGVPGLKNPGERAARQGYKGGVGENISMGRPTGRGAFDGWFHSSGHHRNMLGAAWTEMGAGRSEEHFTQVFGRLTGKSLVEPDPLLPPAPDVAPDPDPPPEVGK